MNRQSGPEVVEYNRGTYDPYYNPNTNPNTVHPTTIYHNGPNNTHVVNHDSVQKPIPNSELRQSQANRRGSRFDEYKRRAKEYKYNFFSMIDEPWNKCC